VEKAELRCSIFADEQREREVRGAKEEQRRQRRKTETRLHESVERK